MSIIHKVSNYVYPCYKDMIDYLLIERKKDTLKNLKTEINLNIILNCTCYIEGFLEKKTKSIVTYYEKLLQKIKIDETEIRRNKNIFLKRIFSDINNRISQCTGIDSYDNIYKLLLEKSFKEDKNISSLLEGIKILFQLRNVIAHGREINAYEIIRGYGLQEIEYYKGEEFFFGGYRNAETFLLKKGLIKKKFIDTGNGNILFSNKVTNYFINITNNFITAIDKFTDNNLKLL